MADAAAYRRQLQGLLPQGAAWPRDPDAVLTQLLDGLAEEFARVDGRAADLIGEADPRTTADLLPDWERVAGLPDPCAGPAATVEARRAAVVARLTARGGASPAYFAALAAALGYPGAIVEDFAPFRADWSCADDPAIDEFVEFQAGISAADDPLIDDGAAWRYSWAMTVEPSFAIEFAADESCADDPLRDWGNPFVECWVRRVQPAHTRVWFYHFDPFED